MSYLNADKKSDAIALGFRNLTTPAKPKIGQVCAHVPVTNIGSIGAHWRIAGRKFSPETPWLYCGDLQHPATLRVFRAMLTEGRIIMATERHPDDTLMLWVRKSSR